MARSKIEVINNALITLGATQITDLSEGSNEATLANQRYDSVRVELLRSHPWNFAIKEIELPKVADGGDFKHANQFNLPSDFLRLLAVYNDNNFKLKGRSVFTNRNECKIRYIADIEDPAIWDASFSNVMAYKLAASLAYSITKSTSLLQAITSLAEDALRKARSIDASEDIEDPIAPYDSPLIGARF